jgi:hypothetical protein
VTSMTHPNGGPFYCADVRRILSETLRGRQRPPDREETERLTLSLNLVAGAYQFAKKFASAKPQSTNVQGALETLMAFFDERREECRGLCPASKVAFAEYQLYNKFRQLIAAFEEHPFELDMDTVLVMPDYNKDWHDIAYSVAQIFRTAMQAHNPNEVFGRSNGGPVPRFVAAVMPTITGGEFPTLAAVAQHLKRVVK